MMHIPIPIQRSSSAVNGFDSTVLSLFNFNSLVQQLGCQLNLKNTVFDQFLRLFPVTGFLPLSSGEKKTDKGISSTLAFSSSCLFDLTDVSIVDEDIISILADDTNWAIQGTLEM